MWLIAVLLGLLSGELCAYIYWRNARVQLHCCLHLSLWWGQVNYVMSSTDLLKGLTSNKAMEVVSSFHSNQFFSNSTLYVCHFGGRRKVWHLCLRWQTYKRMLFVSMMNWSRSIQRQVCAAQGGYTKTRHVWGFLDSFYLPFLGYGSKWQKFWSTHPSSLQCII